MPDNLPAAPLKALLARAAKTLPAVTGETARAADAARRRAAGEALTLLCDTSGSMAADAGGRPAIAHLREAVDGVLADLPHARLVAFSSSARVCGSAADLPAPSGGTALHAGLDEAAKGRPEKIVVVSDGEPDDEAAALRAAARCGCRIDVIYCGPDGGAGLAFLRRLAAAAGGEVVTCDLVGATRLGRDRPLLTQVRRLAGLPAPR